MTKKINITAYLAMTRGESGRLFPAKLREVCSATKLHLIIICVLAHKLWIAMVAYG